MPSKDDDIWKAYTKKVKRLPKESASFWKTFSSTTPRVSGDGRKKVDPEPSQAFHKGLLSIPSSIGPSDWVPDKFAFFARGEKSKFSGMTHEKFDRAAERRYRSGDITLDARIDLHGMTQAEAHAALEKFIAGQVKAGAKNLLVITGKGKGNQGVLRANLPGWLQSLPNAAAILGLRPAAPKHGGDGAFYVILKRKKDRAK